MTTINLTNTSQSSPVQITSGQYLLAVNGIEQGDTAQLYVNVGEASDVVVTDALFEAAGTKVVWLPNCTAYMAYPGQAPTGYRAALASLATDLT